MGTHHVIRERDLDKAAKSDMAPLPAGWDRTIDGEPMPDIVAFLRESRAGRRARMLVIDANVVVDFCVSKAGFDAPADHELVAPPLLRAEALCVLHVMRWRRVVSPHVIDTALERLGSAPIGFTDPRGLAHEAWRIAEEFGWKKTYDAEYVALARLPDCRLLTLDERLRRGAERLGFVIAPSDLCQR